MTTINANNRKCAISRIQTVDDTYSRTLELLEDYGVTELTIVCTGTVMLFVDDQVILNSKLDTSDNTISTKAFLEILNKQNPEFPIKSFNHSWSLEAIGNNGKRLVLIDASKTERFVMPEISYDTFKEHVEHHVDVELGDCSYDRFCEMMGLESHAHVAPVFEFDTTTINRWRQSDSVPLAIAVRSSLFCHGNINYLQTGQDRPFIHEPH